MGEKKENSNNLSKEMKERIGQIANHYSCSVRKLEDKCQVGRGNFSRATAILGFDKIAKIIEFCPEISAAWLLTGKGEMFVTQSSVGVDNLSNPISEDKNLIEADQVIISRSVLQELTQTIRTQASGILEQQRFINEHFGREGSRRVSPPHKYSEYPDRKSNKG